VGMTPNAVSAGSRTLVRRFALSHVRQMHAVGSRCGPKRQRGIDAEMTPKVPLGTCPRIFANSSRKMALPLPCRHILLQSVRRRERQEASGR
jgi:hypothetical protein